MKKYLILAIACLTLADTVLAVNESHLKTVVLEGEANKISCKAEISFAGKEGPSLTVTYTNNNPFQVELLNAGRYSDFKIELFDVNEKEIALSEGSKNVFESQASEFKKFSVTRLKPGESVTYEIPLGEIFDLKGRSLKFISISRKFYKAYPEGAFDVKLTKVSLLGK